jgi:hypothetical protein
VLPAAFLGTTLDTAAEATAAITLLLLLELWCLPVTMLLLLLLLEVRCLPAAAVGVGGIAQRGPSSCSMQSSSSH